MSAFGGKADMPIALHMSALTQSGHGDANNPFEMDLAILVCG